MLACQRLDKCTYTIDVCNVEFLIKKRAADGLQFLDNCLGLPTCTAAMVAPRSASAIAIALPMPAKPPVMIAIRPSR